MSEIIGILIDNSTGYRLVVKRVEHEDYNISYEIDLHAPRTTPQTSMSDHFDGNLIDPMVTVPLKSDGTGVVPLGQ